MRKIIILVLLSTLLLPITAAAQVKIYIFQGHTYTQAALDTKLKSIKTTFEQQGGYKYTTVSYKLLDSKLSNDTLFNQIEVVLSQSNSEPLDILKGVQTLIDKPLPPFELQDLEYQLNTEDILQGQVTLINLWFTSCRPCITEIPYLNYLKDSYGDRVQFKAITFNNQVTVTSFLKNHRFDFDHLVDAGTYLKGTLKNNAYPKLILVDTSGVVRFVANGVELSGNSPDNPSLATTEIEKQLNYLLKQK